VTYASTYPAIGFAPDLNTLGPSATAGTPSSSTNAVLLDNVLGASSPGGAAAGTANPKSGYLFYITATAGSAGAPTSTYASNANPITVDQTGKRYFYSDASGVIRYNTTVTATSADAALQ